MNKDQVLEAVRREVTIDRALYRLDTCMITRVCLELRFPKADKGHIHWALNTLALEGLVYTRKGEGGVQNYDRGVQKRWRVRITRAEAVQRCKDLGIDLKKERGLWEDDLNSNRFGVFRPNAYYDLPV